MVRTPGWCRLLLRASIDKHTMFLSNLGCPGAVLTFLHPPKVFWMSKCFLSGSRHWDMVGLNRIYLCNLVLGFEGKTRLNNRLLNLFRKINLCWACLWIWQRSPSVCRRGSMCERETFDVIYLVPDTGLLSDCLLFIFLIFGQIRCGYPLLTDEGMDSQRTWEHCWGSPIWEVVGQGFKPRSVCVQSLSSLHQHPLHKAILGFAWQTLRFTCLFD